MSAENPIEILEIAYQNGYEMVLERNVDEGEMRAGANLEEAEGTQPPNAAQPPNAGEHSNSRRGRNYVFTINNPTELLDCDLWSDAISFCVYQEEVGANGTYHYQGYLECVGQKSMSQLHDLEGLEGAHFEIRRGSQGEAIAYCTKVDTRVGGPYYWGEQKEQGKRSDLNEIKRKLDSGANIVSIAHEHFGSFIRYHKSFQNYKRITTAPRDWIMELIIIIGPSGSGKTQEAKRMGGADVYWKSPGKWWDDYDGQHTVIWDEFYGSSCQFSILLRILDTVGLNLECKGSCVNFTSKRIIFTSNQHPRDWYSGETTHQMVWEENPLCRRIREFGRIIQTGAIHVPPPRVAPMVVPVDAEGFVIGEYP